jgi:hypothetical protein
MALDARLEKLERRAHDAGGEELIPLPVLVAAFDELTPEELDALAAEYGAVVILPDNGRGDLAPALEEARAAALEKVLRLAGRA